MSHLPALPFLIPFLASALILLVGEQAPARARALSLLATGLGGAAAIALIAAAGDDLVRVYRLGDWPAPYGITLIADRMAAMMVALLFALALPALVMASASGLDAAGRHFHPLFQLLLAGIAGAFLTGDLFNLFVCFEILLLASYGLLVHGGGAGRLKSGLHYVVLNLTGSTLFLIALGLIYGTLGTLNIADLALVLPGVAATDLPLVRTGLTLLILVFMLKAALLPMVFWLPHVYGAAHPPVAALFAIMTKVGIVAIVRLLTVVVADTPAGRDLVHPWLPVLALGTIAAGLVVAFAARHFARVVAGIVLISSGTLLFAATSSDPRATSALLYYLPHTTLVTGGLFLIGGAIARRRGAMGDRLVRGPVIADRTTLSLGFLILAVAASGLPPLSGFIGKLMLMQGAGAGWQPLWWAVLLLSGLGVTVLLARVGSVLFWEPEGRQDSMVERRRIGWSSAAAVGALVVASPLLAAAAAPVSQFAEAASRQLHRREAWVGVVLGNAEAIERQRRPQQAPAP